MTKWLLIGGGGFLGACCRYAVNVGASRVFPLGHFPWGTLIVNLVGCFVIGFLAGLAHARSLFSEEVRFFVFVGFLGSFTTFSTFGLESFSLLKNGSIRPALVNIGVHVIVGLLAVWAGFALARLLPHAR